MQPLEKTLRKQLENTIKAARDIAEAAAKAALEQVGVGEAIAFAYLSETERELRRKLRVHGRQLGDVRNAQTETQEIERLVEEVAYEHWHRMLFARFLAENNLLMYPDPDDAIAVTLEECEDLAADEGAANGWELAARYAARMLPQIFRPDSPVFQLALPPEHQQKLERLVTDLPLETFTASDSLGWVYQFWQANNKDRINKSEVKIGARELPAVTQLFTEPYMVSFLLDNSLGAWWAAHRLSTKDIEEVSTEYTESTEKTEEELRKRASIPGVPLEYLRFVKVKVEAASSRLKEIGYFHKDDDVAHLSGNLPHWRQDNVTYFVTFRTADSLPQQKLNQWQTEKEAWQKENPEPHDEQTRDEFHEKFPKRIQQWLDNGYGECLLRLPELRVIVENALKHFDGERYDLDEFVVMPNHVHVLVTPKNNNHLSDILHSWKSYTATVINKKTEQHGSFWQKESFDHIVRSPIQMEKIRNYIRDHAAYENKRQDAASTIWLPAAGTFERWPEHLSALKTLDPCCGSGHFLVAAFLMLVPMRMELEGLTARVAVDRVLTENIHGLELDQRCVELAAFALAITAWRYPNAGGYRALPELHIACSGLSVSVAKEEWKQLGLGKKNLTIALDWLHDTFKDAPVLGSLLNPAKTQAAKIVQWDELSQTLAQALAQEQTDEQHEIGVVAQGLSKAATLLAGQYQWVITNVPYLKRDKQNERLRDFCEKHYSAGKNDLATVFLARSLELCVKGGTASIVLPQNWLFLTTYKKFRKQLLHNDTWHLIARLGPGAFETISGEVVKAILITLTHSNTAGVNNGLFDAVGSAEIMRGVDVSSFRTASEKAAALLTAKINSVKQAKQLQHPDAVVVFHDVEYKSLLSEVATINYGSKPGQTDRVVRFFWEFWGISSNWQLLESTPSGNGLFTGKEKICLSLQEIDNQGIKEFGIRSPDVWGKRGIIQSQMSELPYSLYNGYIFDNNTSVLHAQENENLASILCFIESGAYLAEVRKLNQKLDVAAHTMVKIPFDIDRWIKVAEEKYPNGLPKSYSDDPTQWIFHGHPAQSYDTLQVAVARLLGYRWPAELDTTMELSDEARAWVKQSETLLSQVDDDGIVCIPPVRGEASASDRLFNMLVAAYSDSWSNDILAQLLKQADHADKSLETWLREKFFTQHCKLFKHRPFIWHIWDGLPDGFAALVNYHKLDAKLLETLIYTYLGDWISRQKQDINNGVDSAQEKLAAAEALKKKLELIMTGEAPYDIFVRWKPLDKQPIGWNPDLNDGVRLNIRPFLSVPDVGKRGAGILRDKPNIKWEKDRGKDPESAPWYHLFNGDRINDHHLTLAEKRNVHEKQSTESTESTEKRGIN